MSWFKADDQLPFHPKVIAAGNAAMGLWIRAGTWSSSQLTDGFIPSAMASAMANGCDADALVDAGLWHRVDGGGYQFHDWSEFQPSADIERQKREDRKRAGRAGAAARWGANSDGKRHGKRHSGSHGTSDGKPNGKTMPRSRPPLSSNEERGRKRPSRPIPDDWTPNDSHRAKATKENIDLPKEAEKFRDNALAHDRRYVDWDRAFSNWLSKDWVTKLPESTIPSFWR